MKLKNSLEKKWLTASAAFVLIFSVNYVHAHSAPLNQVAAKACDNKERAQSCQYIGGHNDLYIGFCRYRYMTGDDLICVRTEPLRKADPKKEGSNDHHRDYKARPKP